MEFQVISTMLNLKIHTIFFFLKTNFLRAHSDTQILPQKGIYIWLCKEDIEIHNWLCFYSLFWAKKNPKKNQTIFLCNFLELQCFFKKMKIVFANENIEKQPSKFAHNQAKFYFSVLPTGPKPAQISISIS